MYPKGWSARVSAGNARVLARYDSATDTNQHGWPNAIERINVE